jgi:very-short-patch-repair endonuclease
MASTRARASTGSRRGVADAVVEHIRTVPHLSLGVGTFNLRQQIAIQDELELRRRQDPALDFFFAPRDEGAFFVKNLENIQGDDRDVILLSVTYAKGPDGRLRHNFGPINGENGWRRLNVLTTRARLRMRVYSSMLGDEINLAQTSAAGARYLREFLLFAERGQLPAIEVAATASPPSPFEQQILQTLAGRGIRVVPQVGVAGYRVDLGVLDERVDGRFVCGLECDGVAYHSAETARDRDRLRQQVLEGLGWTIHRVWSTDWFKDPDSQLERLIARISPSPGPSPQGGGERRVVIRGQAKSLP